MTKTTAVATVGGGGLPAPAGEVSELVSLAIREKVPVEVLERLVALQERVTERNARMAFFEAVAAFQEEVTEIPKSRTAKIATRGGSSYSYTFAPLESITRTIRQPLRNHGLSYSWDTEPGERPDVLDVVCVLRHIDGHEERSRFPVPMKTDAAMSDAQKAGAALTYGRRQSLVAVLGLTTADEDNDAPAQETAYVTDSQAADLGALADEVGADRDKFLGFLGVESFGEIPAARYKQAVAALERKRKGGS
jgi:hypothetical protein